MNSLPGVGSTFVFSMKVRTLGEREAKEVDRETSGDIGSTFTNEITKYEDQFYSWRNTNIVEFQGHVFDFCISRTVPKEILEQA